MRTDRFSRLLVISIAASFCIAWSPETTRHVAWTAVDFFPSDLARQVRKHHKRYDAGIRRGLNAPPAWRAGAPGKLEQALLAQANHCYQGLKRPIPLDDLVEEIGVLAVHVLDANDPLAVEHTDLREPQYSLGYQRYVDSALFRVRLVYYGQDRQLIHDAEISTSVKGILERSRGLYPFVGEEFFRGGSLQNWRRFDDQSVAFGVAGISLSRALTDLANFAAYIWHGGGGLVPTPVPTPEGHVGPTVTVTLGGGFEEHRRPSESAAPALPPRDIKLPPIER